MRALFTLQPGYGDLFPMVPFARALEQAGHSVAFATGASFCAVVERAGFDCFPAGIDVIHGEDTSTDPRAAQAATLLELVSPYDQWLFQHTQWFRTITARAIVPDLLGIARAWHPDLIVRDFIEFGGCIMAELLGLPHALVGAVEFWPAFVEQALRPALDDLRAAHGLPPDPAGQMSHRYLTITGLPPEWVGPHEHCPPTTHFVRPVPFDDRAAGPAPAWLAELPEQPTVHASLGTVFNAVPGLYEAILDGLRDEPVNLIVTVGNRDPAAFGPQPGNVRIEPFLSHAHLLPRCDLMLSHAGYGSTMALLLHGLPSVLLPITADQPRNAARVAGFGAGVVLPDARRSPERIRQAVREVFGDATYRQQAERMQHRLGELPSLDHAVGLLERLVADKRPLVSAGDPG